ncbi:MAG: hypothetical protein NXI04_05595 [Planctomycetaceae bacterium]|nr:hypothetical protein [Planctomycetaceae bacterium]
MSKRQLIIIGLLSVASVGMVMWPNLPLGVPGEWTWQRHNLPATAGESTLRLLWPCVAAALLLAVSRWAPPANGASLAGSCSRHIALLIAACCWWQAVQTAAPLTHKDLKPLWVLYSPSASGYFLEAAVAMPSTTEFLQTYEARMQEGDVLHVGTHPPGLFLLSRGCIQACGNTTVSALVDKLASTDSADAFSELAREARLSRPLSEQEMRGLQLLCLITQLSIPLTLLPLMLLVGAIAGREAAWRCGCLWATLPCLAIFFPKSDLLFPLTSLSVLALTFAALNGQGGRRLLAIPAGIMLWLGLLLSLAHLPTIAVLVLMTLTRWWQTRGDRQVIRGDVITGALVLGTVLACSVAWSLATSCNLLRVWQWNLSNHAGFYEQYTRTYWKWLLVNPVELCLAVGAPVAASAVLGIWTALRQAPREQKQTDQQPLSHPPAQTHPSPMIIGLCGVILLLWLSGKNQGEAARLWCFMAPWILVIGAGTLKTLCTQAWQTILALQLLVSVATVLRVNGFSF